MLKRRNLLGSRAAVRPGRVSAAGAVPAGIRRPGYVGGEVPDMERLRVGRKGVEAVRGMREACEGAASALLVAGMLVKAGRTTSVIDDFTHKFIVDVLRAYPSPLGYNGFPRAICTSINEVLCHGIPDDRPLQNGDMLNIDVSIYTAAGYHGDCSQMFTVGQCDPVALDLIRVTQGALDAAIDICRPGERFSTIGDVISRYVARHSSFSVVDEFTGHGIGTEFHMQPYIVHTPNNYPGVMEEGHTFTIEPVVVEGRTAFSILSDNWTAVSKDYGRGAQVEHTVLITPSGAEILTIGNKEMATEFVSKIDGLV